MVKKAGICIKKFDNYLPMMCSTRIFCYNHEKPRLLKILITENHLKDMM